MSPSLPTLTLLGALLAAALACDTAQRRIPNWLVLAGLTAGLACSLWAAPGEPAPLAALLGALLGLIIMLPLYALRTMGAGDAKLMAAVGSFLGPLPILGAALLTFAAGGVLALGAALWSGSLGRVLGNLRLLGLVLISGRSAGVALSDVQTTGRLPYAFAIAIGTALQLWLATQEGWVFA
ncbi:prepilin peptidase [Dechloromonas sp. XY25]|uniref:Prepilin peptidase n=1 Tax=Dechloromonas hankyongensis TaxID=2908002 RepID=A0ABS9JZX8_9RHOO|nr:prepilin peptidase [Dechloromonas hankyongensis]MCG2576468.1 prepilin peptidase [Dechloromonas hankyongensis]